MVSEYEARKLQQDSKRELNATPATVWKCAAGLVGVVIFALRLRIGVNSPSVEP